ncbi:MAG: hypothetical protein MZV70_73375 [Desulfobacterales bacterium]|nr:hypothetical protein [Desulfobacterales bacterium]
MNPWWSNALQALVSSGIPAIMNRGPAGSAGVPAERLEALVESAWRRTTGPGREAESVHDEEKTKEQLIDELAQAAAADQGTGERVPAAGRWRGPSRRTRSGTGG